MDIGITFLFQKDRWRQQQLLKLTAGTAAFGGITSELCMNFGTQERQDHSKVLAQPIAMSVAAIYSADGSYFFVFRSFFNY